MAEEKEQWITLKSGKKVKLDENGNVIAGFQGFMGKNVSKLKEESKFKNKPYSKSGKNFETYLQENGNDKTKAAREFFRENLQDKYVTTTINGQPADIHFTGGSWQEFRRKIADSETKASFLEDVPDVLQHYKTSKGLSHARDDFSKFHYFEHEVEKEINGKKIKAGIKVDVGTRKNTENENEAYHYKVTKITEDTKKAGGTAEGYHFTPNGINEPQKEAPSHFSQPALDKNIPVQYEVVNIEITELEDEMNRHDLAMDSASKRSIDQNGFMHVEISNITKESVDPYRGYEIPRAKAFGLDPDKIYMGYRSGEELKKAAHTFNGLPITREHHVDSAENPQREHRVGSIGTDCAYNAPYLQAGVTITDGEAIRKIESGERMEFSAGYFFEPVFEKGEFEGKAYDFIMTEIKGNHVALVETGRAGADVCVADSKKAVQDVLTPRSASEAKTALFASESECAAGRCTERSSTDSGENIQQLQENITNNQNEDNMEEIKKETQAQDEDLREEWKKNTEFEEKKEELLKDECKPAADDDDDIAEILQKAGIETGDEELKKAFLAGMAYARKEFENPAKSEEVLEKKTVVEEKEDVRPAMDADTIKRQLRQELRDVQNAVREVIPLVGELDAMAFDTGDAVYSKACEVMGVNASKRTARDVCRALLSTGRTPQPVMVMDSGMHGFRSRFDNN